MADKEATLIIRLKDEASNALKGLQGSIAGLGTRFLGVAGILTGLVAVLVSSAKAYMENESAVNRLSTALRNQGVSNQEVSLDLQKYALNLAKVTVYSDEALMGSQAFFVTLGFGSEKIKKATQMAADLASTLSLDLHTATMMVGKALNGNDTILKRYGLTLGDVERMHGAAASQAKTLSGHLANLSNRVDELKEGIGAQLLPTLQAWVDWLEKIMVAVEGVTGATDKGLSGRQLTIAALVKESDQLATTIQMYDNYGNSNMQAAKAAQDRYAKVEAALTRERALLASETAKKGGTSFAGSTSAGDKEDEAKRLAKLDTETANMVQKMTTREQAIQQLKQQYKMTDSQMLVQNLGIQEALEAESLARRLEAAGKNDQAKLVREAAVLKAQKKNEEDLAKWRLKQDEDRKKNFVDTLTFISTLAESKNKALAAIGKAASIANATISTYEAANKALASAPPPWNFALVALVVAAGMANVAKIAGVQMAQGGIVQARPGGTLATIGEGGRSEAVIPLNDPRARQALGGMGGSVGNVYVTVNGVNDPREIAAAVGQEIIKTIRGQGQIDFTRT